MLKYLPVLFLLCLSCKAPRVERESFHDVLAEARSNQNPITLEPQSLSEPEVNSDLSDEELLSFSEWKEVDGRIVVGNSPRLNPKVRDQTRGINKWDRKGIPKHEADALGREYLRLLNRQVITEMRQLIDNWTSSKQQQETLKTFRACQEAINLSIYHARTKGHFYAVKVASKKKEWSRVRRKLNMPDFMPRVKKDEYR